MIEGSRASREGKRVPKMRPDRKAGARSWGAFRDKARRLGVQVIGT